MAKAEKPPPSDNEIFFVLALVFLVYGALYVFLHNWVRLLVSTLQCGPEC